MPIGYAFTIRPGAYPRSCRHAAPFRFAATRLRPRRSRPWHSPPTAAKVRQKLYVTNSAGDDVTVIDTATNKAVGRIEVGPHPHGIAVPAAQDVIYVTIEGAQARRTGLDRPADRQGDAPHGHRPRAEPARRHARRQDSPTSRSTTAITRSSTWTRARSSSASSPAAGRTTPSARADGKRMYLAPMGNAQKGDRRRRGDAQDRRRDSVQQRGAADRAEPGREAAVRRGGRAGRHRDWRTWRRARWCIACRPS